MSDLPNHLGNPLQRPLRKQRTISAWGMPLRKKLGSWQASDFQGREIPAGRKHLFHAWQSPTNGEWDITLLCKYQ
ncbi:MAG: hypothetical protein LAO04_21345 [Acidobacteriia bacterium]|nr:hypothetical protein [Terriglobia bacterium]